ncbi:MAG: trxA [Paenibacillus sp.]|nr:trxA [Paenibacillus sp.]
MSVKHVTDLEFKSSIAAQGVTVVDFGAPWCPPCKTLLPILEELDEELGASATILKLNVEESPVTAAAFGVMSMPAVFIFKDSQPVEKLIGLRPKGVYRSVISRHL